MIEEDAEETKAQKKARNQSGVQRIAKTYSDKISKIEESNRILTVLKNMNHEHQLEKAQLKDELIKLNKKLQKLASSSKNDSCLSKIRTSYEAQAKVKEMIK